MSLQKKDTEPGNPAISVCLLSYNHDLVIGEVIESVLSQSFEDYEFIISDDCSTDDTWKVISDYASRNPRLRPIRTSENLGMAGNSNYAISHARGKFVALLHHDDLYNKDLLQKWLEVMLKSHRIAFVFNDYIVTDGIASHESEKRGFGEIMEGKYFFRKYLISGWGCPVRGTAMLRKSLFDSINGMDLGFELLADVDLWMRLSGIGDVGYVSEPLITIRYCGVEKYPEEYSKFSWKRWRILFDIHGRNIRCIFNDRRILGFLRNLLFRWKVSLEVLRWLAYGVVRRRSDIILRSHECENPYEYGFVKKTRQVLVRRFSLEKQHA